MTIWSKESPQGPPDSIVMPPIKVDYEKLFLSNLEEANLALFRFAAKSGSAYWGEIRGKELVPEMHTRGIRKFIFFGNVVL